jgi:hypothetical protein
MNLTGRLIGIYWIVLTMVAFIGRGDKIQAIMNGEPPPDDTTMMVFFLVGLVLTGWAVASTKDEA